MLLYDSDCRTRTMFLYEVAFQDKAVMSPKSVELLFSSHYGLL